MPSSIKGRRWTDGLQPWEDLEAPKTAQLSHPSKKEEVVEALKGLTFPLTQAEKVACTTLKGFMTPVQGPNIEHRTMKPKAYDLLVKLRYDPTKEATMGMLPREIIESKVERLNETQKKLQCKGYSIKSSTSGLRYTPKPPLRGMIKRVANYHIADVDQEPCIHLEAKTWKTVFQRLGETPTTMKRN
ncbi:hypothetical protein LIER_32191 [Lithospermum erythrorhizon]|uniref:Reverse transcriptase n=1 Tax=Lithospermum erythrorhizon TaxID=34254 RepID=A0AAV3RT72_LITER